MEISYESELDSSGLGYEHEAGSVNTAMKLRVSQKEGNFLIGYISLSASEE
jgi:hypothetical protein